MTLAAVPARTGRGGRRRGWLAAYGAQLAIGAYGGALGLAVGFLDLPAWLDRRLPFDSPAFGGLALALLVGVPATVLTVLAWRGHPWALPAALLDGLLLIGWILVQVAFLREFGVLHGLYLAMGVVLVLWGRTAGPELWRWVARR